MNEKRKQRVRLTVVLLLFLIGGTVLGFTQILSEKARTLLRDASPLQRYEAMRVINERHPTFKSELVGFIARTHPELPVRLLRTEVEQMEAAHPGFLADAILVVVKSTHEKRPTLFWDVAGDLYDLLVTKYPRAPRDFRAAWLAAGGRAERVALVEKQCPGLRARVLSGIQEKDPNLHASLVADATHLVRERYPDLPIRIAGDLARLSDKHPGLRVDLARLREQEGRKPLEVLSLVASKYPAFGREAIALMKTKYAEELHRLTVDLLTMIRDRHGKALGRTAVQVLATVEKECPTVGIDLLKLRLQQQAKVRETLARAYPSLGRDVATLMTDRYPTVRKEIRAAILDRFPTLETEMKKNREAAYPTLMADLRRFMSARFPTLERDLLGVFRSTR